MLCKYILKKFVFVMYVALYCLLKNKYIFKNKRKKERKEKKENKKRRKERKRKRSLFL